MTTRLAMVCALGLVTASAMLSARSPVALPAAWHDMEIRVDGDEGDWRDPATAVPDTPLFVSVASDAEWLYLRVRVVDRAGQLQVLFSGLTTWFDPKGGERKAFGIRYPVGTPLPAPGSRGTRGSPPAGRPGEGDPARDPQRSPARTGDRRPLLDPAAIVPPRLEVLGPGKDDARSLVLDHATGLSVGIGRSDAAIVYELRVPLARSADTPYAIGTVAGATIGIGFESAKLEWPRPAGGGPGVGGGTGRPGAGGLRMPGGGMGGRRPPGAQMPEPARRIKAWVKVALARAPDTMAR